MAYHMFYISVHTILCDIDLFDTHKLIFGKVDRNYYK